MGADLTFWDGCRSAWGARFNSIAVNLRGASPSAPLAEPMSFDRHVDDIDAVRADLGLEQVIPVGCAVGAMIAATYAARHPDRCRALVLSNPGLKTLAGAREALAARARTVRREGIGAVLSATMNAAFHPAPEGQLADAFARRFLAQDPESYACAIEGMLHADISPDLPDINCPVLIVGGGEDVLLPVADHAQPLHAALDGSELVIVEDGAHFLPLQQADKFAGIVSDFLDRRLEAYRSQNAGGRVAS